MENSEAIFAFTLLIVFIFAFARIALRIRKSGGTMTTTVHGALDSFYNKDKKKAVEMVVEQQADKKLEEQSASAADDYPPAGK